MLCSQTLVVVCSLKCWWPVALRLFQSTALIVQLCYEVYSHTFSFNYGIFQLLNKAVKMIKCSTILLDVSLDRSVRKSPIVWFFLLSLSQSSLLKP